MGAYALSFGIYIAFTNDYFAREAGDKVSHIPVHLHGHVVEKVILGGVVECNLSRVAAFRRCHLKQTFQKIRMEGFVVEKPSILHEYALFSVYRRNYFHCGADESLQIVIYSHPFRRCLGVLIMRDNQCILCLIPVYSLFHGTPLRSFILPLSGLYIFSRRAPV